MWLEANLHVLFEAFEAINVQTEYGVEFGGKLELQSNWRPEPT